jgi:hypothetical protein
MEKKKPAKLETKLKIKVKGGTPEQVKNAVKKLVK